MLGSIPVASVLVDSDRTTSPHGALLLDTLRANPAEWSLVDVFPGYEVYRSTKPVRHVQNLSLDLSRMLPNKKITVQAPKSAR